MTAVRCKWAYAASHWCINVAMQGNVLYCSRFSFSVNTAS